MAEESGQFYGREGSSEELEHLSPQEREHKMEAGPVNNINEKVIAIQQADGIDVGREWWEKNVTALVGNNADEQAMFDSFLAAYERDFRKGADGKRHPLSPGKI